MFVKPKVLQSSKNERQKELQQSETVAKEAEKESRSDAYGCRNTGWRIGGTRQPRRVERCKWKRGTLQFSNTSCTLRNEEKIAELMIDVPEKDKESWKKEMAF